MTAPSEQPTSSPEQTAAPPPPTRRALLTAGLGGVVGAVAATVSRPFRAAASAGSNLIIGSATNNAGTSNTVLTTNSTVVAFELLQNGAGTALMGYVTPGSGTTRGVYGRTDSPNGDGVQARNAGAAGSGTAVRAFGGNNTGIDASTEKADLFAIRAANASVVNSGGGAVEGNGGVNNGVVGYTLGPVWYGVAATHLDGAGTAMSATGGSTSGRGIFAQGATGVYGQSATPANSAIYGVNAAASGLNRGVHGTIVSTSFGAAGVYGTDGGGTGNTNGVQGVSTSAGGNGIHGINTTNNGGAYAVWGEGSALGYGVVSSGDLLVTGDLTATGSKAGYVVDVAVNGSARTLNQGDAVTLIGVRAPVLGSLPLLVVAAAKKGDPIVGVVDRQAAVTPNTKTPDAGNYVKGKGTTVAPDEHLLVVTLGAFAVASADAADGEIRPGTRLSAGSNGKLVKAKPIDFNGRAIYPAGEHAGYALGSLSAGSGKVGIFVNPH